MRLPHLSAASIGLSGNRGDRFRGAIRLREGNTVPRCDESCDGGVMNLPCPVECPCQNVNGNWICKR